MIVLTYRIPIGIYDKNKKESIREWDLKSSVIKEINDSLHNDIDYFDDLMYYNVDDEITFFLPLSDENRYAIDIRYYYKIRLL